MALSPGEKALYDKAIASGQSTVSSSFVPSAALANVNAALAARSAPTAADYSSFAQSLKGLSPTEQAKKINETSAELQAMGIEVDPTLKSQYVDPIVQSTVNQQVGLPPVDQKVTKTYTAGGRPAPQTPPPAPPQAPKKPIMPDPSNYGITAGPDFKQYLDDIYDVKQTAGNVSQDVLNAGGLNEYLTQQYTAGNIDAVNKVLAEFNMTAQDLVTQFNMTPGDLNYLASQGVVAPGLGQTIADGVTPQVGSMALGALGLGGGSTVINPSVFSKELVENNLGRSLSAEEFNAYKNVYDSQREMGRSHDFIMGSAAFGGGSRNDTLSTPDTVSDPFSAFTAEEANQVYIDLLGRPLGKEGLDYWLNDPTVRQNIPDLATLRATIAQSEEAQNYNRTGVPNTAYTALEQFQMPYQPVQPADIQGDLDAIYRSILGPTRGIQEEGLQHFTNDYNTYRQAGDTHDQALAKIRQSVTDSEEATAFTQAKETSIPYLQQYYTKYLGRQLGQEGQSYWTSEFIRLVNEGTPESQALQMIEGMIANSEEAKIFANTGIAAEVEDPVGEEPKPEQAMTDVIEERMLRPSLPQNGQFDPAFVQKDPSQIIGTDSGIGQVGSAQQAIGATMGTAMTAGAVTPTATQTMRSQTSSPQVNAALDKINPALGSVSEKAQIEAVTMSPTSTDVGTISPAQLAEAQRVQQPQSRTLQSGEMVQSAVDAQKATAFVEEVQSAGADPSAKATVQGQLADLMSQFEDGAIPSWASGAMRTANATLAARGLGASSLAGQAVVQAAMESAIPIAVQDAQTQSQFEQQNLSNRQQRAMLAAQQRAQFMGQEFDQEFQARVANAAKISDIANMNFTAEQQIALENARLAQSVDLANLSNQQAMVMAETAQISQLELSNLNNRQQAAVQNAQSFLQMDLTNLSNTQQTTMFDAQSRVNALFSDAAAENASRQFNATSENQTNQFFQSLQTQVQQFNANQLNTMEQIRLEQTNIMSKFNAQLMAQQEQFNATNQLAIAQSDAQWNRQLATLDTAAINSANQFNAQAILEMSNQAFANAAQILRDQMDYAFQAGQKDADRELQIVIQKMSQDASKYAADAQEDAAWSTAVGTLAAAVLL